MGFWSYLVLGIMCMAFGIWQSIVSHRMVKKSRDGIERSRAMQVRAGAIGLVIVGFVMIVKEVF